MNTSTFPLFAAISLAALAACTADTADSADVPTPPTYTMRLLGGLSDYDQTRAPMSWQTGARVLLRFHDPKGIITGTAVFQQDETWTVTPTQALTDGSNATVEATYISGYSGAGTSTIALDETAAIYRDTLGTYIAEEQMLSVTATLRPVMSRLRLQGQQGRSLQLTGLSHATAFAPATGTLTMSAAAVGSTVGTDGYTPYMYVLLTAADRRLTLARTSATAYVRTCPDDVLRPATSGFMALPATDHSQMNGWTLVNTANQQEITAPTLSATAASDTRSRSTTLTATLTSAGNGQVSAAGFVYATTAQPTLDNAAHVALSGNHADGTTLTTRLSGLQPLTQYFVRAYATNERTTAYGPQLTFTTTDAPPGSSIDIDDYGQDSDWTNGQTRSQH